MTKVFLSHNPFKIQTQILVDGEQISETSALYKFVSTPMQDWVVEFIPALIEHCNDDEIDIVFKGLQYNYDDLEGELERFLKENREYEITLELDVCRSQTARLGALEDVIEEINTQEVFTDLQDNIVLNKADNGDTLQIVVMGGTDEHRSAFIDDLLKNQVERSSKEIGYYYKNFEAGSDGNKKEEFEKNMVKFDFAENEFCQLEIYELPHLATCKNTYYRFAKQAITSVDKPVVIYLLESVLKYNDAQMLNLLSEQYRIKGKHNKWRFIFVAEEPISCRKMLNSEFAIRNAVIYAFDDILKIKKHIEEYQNEVHLIRQVKKKSNQITQQLEDVARKVSVMAEQEKKIAEISALEKNVLEELDKSEFVAECLYEQDYRQNESIDKFVMKLTKEFTEACFGVKEQKSEEDNVGKERDYVLSKLSSNVFMNLFSFMETMEDKFKNQFITETTEVQINTKWELTEKLLNYVAELNSETVTGNLKKIQNSIQHTYFGMVPLRSEEIAKIEEQLLNVKQMSLSSELEAVKNKNNLGIAELGSISAKKQLYFLEQHSQAMKNKNSSERAQVLNDIASRRISGKTYYECLENIICYELIGEYYTSLNTIKKCQEHFKRAINKTRPILKLYFGWCIAERKKYVSIPDGFEADLEELKNVIKIHFEKLRQEAEISEENKRRLVYIKTLQARVENLVDL